ATKFVLLSPSLSDVHEPLPEGNVAPAVGTPLMSTADTNRTPPVARTANSLEEADAKFGGTVSRKSDQTKAPSCSALAPLPAAKLPRPPALFAIPPGTTAPIELVRIVFAEPPPITDAEAPSLIWFQSWP